MQSDPHARIAVAGPGKPHGDRKCDRGLKIEETAMRSDSPTPLPSSSRVVSQRVSSARASLKLGLETRVRN